MVKTRSTHEIIRLTNNEEVDLDRFGCMLKSGRGMLCVDWRGKNSERASEAKIFARFAGVETKEGPIFLLACEISVVRPLPQYCYFPFDLKKLSHRNFFNAFAKTGEIKLGFVMGKRLITRTHRLTPVLRSRASEIYSECLQALDKYGIEKYEFERPLQLLQRWMRIPELLERLLTEDDLPELFARINGAVQVIPKEDRDFAKQIVREASDAFGPYAESNWKTSSGTRQIIQRGFVYISDLQLLFGENTRALKEFLGDAIAASFSRSELEALDEWHKLGVSALGLFSKPGQRSEPEDTTVVPSLPVGLIGLLQSVVPHRRISLNSLKALATLFGLEVKGMPGRPSEDYSREYDLRLSGLSWSKVARQMIAESPYLRVEFGVDNYDSLDRGRQEVVTNRIRQGVIAFAKRTGKPLPSPSEPSESDSPDGAEKN